MLFLIFNTTVGDFYNLSSIVPAQHRCNWFVIYELGWPLWNMWTMPECLFTVRSQEFKIQELQLYSWWLQKQIKALRYKLRMMGVPLAGATNVFCDNESVCMNATVRFLNQRIRRNTMQNKPCRLTEQVGIYISAISLYTVAVPGTVLVVYFTIRELLCIFHLSFMLCTVLCCTVHFVFQSSGTTLTVNS